MREKREEQSGGISRKYSGLNQSAGDAFDGRRARGEYLQGRMEAWFSKWVGGVVAWNLIVEEEEKGASLKGKQTSRLGSQGNADLGKCWPRLHIFSLETGFVFWLLFF